jgi:hypothetical protein
MKGIHKPVVEFVGWRWAPTVGLLSAALLYVGIVVALVPDEIGGPVPASRSVPAPRVMPTQTAEPEQTTFSARTEEAPQPVVHTPPPTPVTIQPAEFGRRGFSPPLERPNPPPEPVITPPPPPPPPVIPPPPPAPDPAVAAAAPPHNPMQRGLVGAAFNAARRVAGQVEANVTGNVAPAPGQTGAAPVAPPGAPVTPDGAPPAEAPATPAGEAPPAPPPAPPIPVQ